MVIPITDDLIVAAIDVAVYLDNRTMVNVTSCESRFCTASPACAILLSYFGTIPICIFTEKVYILQYRHTYINTWIVQKSEFTYYTRKIHV